MSHASESALTVCVDYHCERQRQIQLSPDEWSKILTPFAETAKNAHAERVKISRSIALFEEIVGPHAGTDIDMAENNGEGDQIGQLDCISESRNTEEYLGWLKRKGVLHWHDVESRISRSPLLFDIHWTAVIRERDNHERFVVDSWFYANGQAPVIQPVQQWLNKEPVNNQFIP